LISVFLDFGLRIRLAGGGLSQTELYAKVTERIEPGPGVQGVLSARRRAIHLMTVDRPPP
jgi:hypothetical protein